MLDFILKVPEVSWVGDGAWSVGSKPQPRKPRLREVVIVVPLTGDRVAFRKGTTYSLAAVIQDLPDKLVDRCLKLMDGRHTRNQIVAEVRERCPQVKVETLDALLCGLHEVGVLEDAAAEETDCLTPEELARYSRNINCWSDMPSNFSSKYEPQNRLRRASVLVLGVGGLGSNCALGLAMLGTGRLTLVDDDLVELQNLNRQVLYDSNTVGQPKARAAAERLRVVNPSTKVTAIPQRIASMSTVEGLIREGNPDIVVLAADRPVRTIDRWVSEACFRTGVPYVTGGVCGIQGYLWSKVPGQTGCDECDRLWLRDLSADDCEVMVYREDNDLIPATSALGFGAQIVGGLVGYDVLRHLLGEPMESAGSFVAIDFFTMTTLKTERPPHPECQVCPATVRQAATQRSCGSE